LINEKEIFILILILRFVLQRVFVADIVAKKEEYAFEMFDSLNTTGDPLTAKFLTKPSFASIFLYSSRKYILCSLNFLDNALPFSDRENVVIS
jgi:hypothetical protein